MPDVTLVISSLTETGEAKHLEMALRRLGSVGEVNVDSKKGLVAISYEGGEAELEKIGEAVREVGYEPGLSPGAEEVAED